MTDTTDLPTISALALLYVLPHCSKEDHRPILNGVYCRADGVLVATNGHTLGMFENGHTLTDGAILAFPKTALAVIKRAVKENEDAVLVMRPYDGGYMAESQLTGESFTCPTVEGPYPRTDGVLPREYGPVGCLALDPAKVKLFYQHKGGGEKALRFAFQSPTRAIAVTASSEPGFFGLLMPCRWGHGHQQDGEASTFATPEWATEEKAEAAKDAA